MVKIIVEPKKNRDTGENEIVIKLSNSEVKWIKSAVHKYIGDADDEQESELREHIRSKFLECKNMMNPS